MWKSRPVEVELIQITGAAGRQANHASLHAKVHAFTALATKNLAECAISR